MAATETRLFKLPTELRLTIYRNLFEHMPQKNEWLPLLYTNRKIYLELRDILHETALYIRIPSSSTAAATKLMMQSRSDESRCADTEDYTWRQFKGLLSTLTFASYCKQFRTVILDLGLGNPIVGGYGGWDICAYYYEMLDLSEDWEHGLAETFAALEQEFARFLDADDGTGNSTSNWERPAGRVPELRVLWWWRCKVGEGLKRMPWLADRPAPGCRGLEGCVILEQVIRQEQMRRRESNALTRAGRCPCENHVDRRVHPSEETHVEKEKGDEDATYSIPCFD
jgi:hypothetical protein